MGGKHADRIWAAAGAFGALVLLAVGWFLLIGPQKEDTAALQAQVTESHDQAASLQRKLVDLREQERDKPKYQAELEADRKALPDFPSTTDFVRQMRAAGDRTEVVILNITIGDGEDDGNGVFKMPISITAAGKPGDLEDFMDQVQRIQPRAQLVRTVAMTAVENEAESGEEEQEQDAPPEAYALSLSVNVFVSPAEKDGQ